MDSVYFDLDQIAQRAAAGEHREIVGGAWEEIGRLQFLFLVSQGLSPHHKFLDVGCGALRGGIYFAAYLDPGCYFGVDISQALLDQGRKELSDAGIADRVPLQNLLCSDGFLFSGFNETLDFAIAQSVFTHLGFNRIRRCLEQISDVLADGGVFFATFFERPDDVQSRQSLLHATVQTSDVSDPYHYSFRDFVHACHNLPLQAEYIGDWGHPRAQKMIAFRKTSSQTEEPLSHDRQLNIDEAMRLPPGADHYRAFVGPPGRYDFMSATQFSLLFCLGLLDSHKVLDIGCGSLRLGRLLIPFLRTSNYFGIEPYRWLITEALRAELGDDAVRIKKPRFSDNSNFDCKIFGTTFDFVIAQSIATHCGPDLLASLITNAGSVLGEQGLFAFSYCRSDGPATIPANGWHYPECVFYDDQTIDRFLDEAGLVGRAIPWFHPGANWYLGARDGAALPREEDLQHLNGRVLRHPQFSGT